MLGRTLNNTIMEYSQQGITLTQECEGLYLTAYPDTGGVWSIAYGHTHNVRQGMTCTQAQATAWLLEDIASSVQNVRTYVTVPLSQGQFDALVDFVYNIGPQQFVRSTLLTKLNNKDYLGASLEFKRWNQDNGVVLAGLVKRRALEEALFNTVTVPKATLAYKEPEVSMPPLVKPQVSPEVDPMMFLGG